MISATADLYGGTCSNEAVQVEEAWYAVGVGDAPSFIYISGDDAFCSSATYSLSETDGGTVTWSVSPSGVVSLTPSGNSVTATKITKGNATLTATLTRTCGNLALTRDISTDPQVTLITATDQGCYNGYESWALTANPNMSNATNWQWKVDNPNPNYPIYIESPNSQSTNVEVQGGGGISVTYQDAFGETSERNGITVYSGSCSYSSVTISPNPATNTITITNQSYNQNHFLKTIPTAEKNATLGLAYIKEVKVYDITGRLREEKTFSGKMNQVQIDVSGLTPGMYILKISDGKFTKQQKTVIQ